MSKHFTLEELTFSEWAARNGINNTPTSRIVENLEWLAERLEDVRTLLGWPMRVTSGFRSAAVNAGVNGSLTSQHRFGLACDFVCPAFGSPAKVVAAIVASGLQFDQLIDELGWIHISFVRNNPRRMVGLKQNGKDITWHSPSR